MGESEQERATGETANADLDKSRRLSMSARTLMFTEQVGIGLIRLDTATPELNAPATEWLGGHVETFLSHPKIVRALNTTDPGAQWDYTLPSGRTIRVKRLCAGARLWLALTDVTLETDHATIMADVADVGTGFLYFIPSTGRHRVYGSFLDQKLSPNEQLEIRQRGILPLIHKRDQERGLALITRMMREGVPFRTIIECRTRRGDCFTLDVAARAIRASDGTICKSIAVFRDVTKERRAQAELIRLRNEAASNQEAQNHLLARVGHEIRTPMSGVIGMADALMNMPGTEDFRSQLSIIQDATRDALSMLDETMDFSKLGTDQFRLREDEVDVSELVQASTALWTQRAAAVGTQMRLRRDAHLPDAVVLDSRRLRQCLTNLLSNAVKFTENGTIEIILGSMTAGEHEKLIIAVRDNGVGMTAAEQAQLFTPYAQGRAGSAVGGTGLGLSITREIVRRMGGDIRCTSTKGDGTTFVISLPLKQPETQRDLVGTLLADRESETEPRKLRVLAVDDNVTNRLVVEQLLAGRVTSVDLAEDGIDAIAQLDAKTYDVVLMDIHMPRMDGIEATLKIRNSGKPYANIPIIALTADAEYQQKRVAMNIGMDDALAKPVTLSSLLEAFDRLRLYQDEDKLLTA